MGCSPAVQQCSTGGEMGVAPDPYFHLVRLVLGQDGRPTDNLHVLQQQRERGSAGLRRAVLPSARAAWLAPRLRPLLDG